MNLPKITPVSFKITANPEPPPAVLFPATNNIMPDKMPEPEQMKQDSDIEKYFVQYFNEFADNLQFFNLVVAGEFTALSCCKEIKSIYGCDMPQYEFKKLLLKHSAPMPYFPDKSVYSNKKNVFYK